MLLAFSERLDNSSKPSDTRWTVLFVIFDDQTNKIRVFKHFNISKLKNLIVNFKAFKKL